LLLLLVELLHVCTWVNWLKTLELSVVVHAYLLGKLLVLELLLSWLIQLVKTSLIGVWLVSWILTTILRFLLLLELHHLLLRLGFWLEGITAWLHRLKALS